jgi:signal transduction histidine kinase
LFEPFFTTKGIGGTGLGLWVSRDILNKHDARISIRSSTRAGCSGTVFSLFFPCSHRTDSR